MLQLLSAAPPFLRDSPTVSVEKWNALGNPDKGGRGKKTLEKLF
jgi:hypothetical protein